MFSIDGCRLVVGLAYLQLRRPIPNFNLNKKNLFNYRSNQHLLQHPILLIFLCLLSCITNEY